ncbi:hypothetical protein BYT27DRAFT_7253643 [Phlegmacium glaucopus]|nr:hypothetical protein BYT27DRAFT_7253643 [Phlegmacium glaucopus]
MILAHFNTVSCLQYFCLPAHLSNIHTGHVATRVSLSCRLCTPSRYLPTAVIEAGSASRSKDDENLAVLDTMAPYTTCPGPSAPPLPAPAHPSHRRCHSHVRELVRIVPAQMSPNPFLDPDQPKTLGDKSLPLVKGKPPALLVLTPGFLYHHQTMSLNIYRGSAPMRMAHLPLAL